MSAGEDSQWLRALEILQAGGLVCVPTESSYGLAVDASNAQAIARLQDLKGRDKAAPFGLIAGTMEDAKACTGAWPAAADALALAHWPGPLTMILPPRATTLAALLGPTGGVGLRVSSASAVTWLATQLGRPITATSANPSGEPASKTVATARQYFGDKVDFYLDGGPCEGVASTLVSFDGQGRAQVLRQGPIVLPEPA